MKKMRMARARINHASLKDVKVAVMKFPYVDAIDTFLASMIECNPERNNANDKIKPEEKPPFRCLNGALVASAPTLIHGFEEYGNSAKQWLLSRLWQKPRQALALVGVDTEQPLWRPEIADLNDLVWVWANQWATECFAQELKTAKGNSAFEKFLHAIQSNEESWAEPIPASQLWSEHNADGIAYHALPSIISALFVQRSRHTPLRMGEHQKPIIWHLAQDGDRTLTVISEPFSHNAGKDKLSYKLEFAIQTQPGRAEPWLAVYIRLRRWGSRQIRSKNFGRKVAVMIKLGSERKEGWDIGIEPTMVRLQVDGSVSKKGLRWVDQVSELLSLWRARPLVDPNELFKNPEAHIPAQDGDSYFILHAEGVSYKGGSHSAKSGTTLQERIEIVQYVQRLLYGTLEFDEPLQIDMPVSLNASEIIANRLGALHTIKDMERVIVDAPRGQTTSARETLQRQRVDKAFYQARHSRLINLLLITREEKRALERVIREMMFLGPDDPFPAYIRITSVALPLDLALPPGGDLPSKYQRKLSEKNKHQGTLTSEWEAKRDAWRTFLMSHTLRDAINLAIIELPGKPQNITEQDDWLKSAVRHACVRSGVISQMVFTFNDNLYGYPYTTQQLPRVRNAVADIIVRQPHILYGSLPGVYQFAGLDEQRANHLVIGGLFRHRQHFPASIDFPVYVELYPDGHVMVTLPAVNGEPTQPVPYLDANIELGNLFCSPVKKGPQSQINFRSTKGDLRLAQFLSAILERKRDQPTLILMEADSWRQEGIYLTSNTQMRKNYLKLGTETLAPEDTPNLSLLRVRDAGAMNETPQYVDTNAWEHGEFDRDDRTVGVIDHNEGEFFRYFSIGRQITQDNTLYAFDDGGDKAFRHQQAIELIPIWGAEPNDEIVFCRIAHLLRSTPAWTGGTITLPYPLHLAKKLIDDAVDVFSPRL